MAKHPTNPHGRRGPLLEVRSRYALAKKMARDQNRNPSQERAAAIEGIVKSSHKFLREINIERKKHYQKPLTMRELIEIIRESE